MLRLAKQVPSAALMLLVLGCAVVHAASEPTGPKLGLQTWTLRHMTFEQVVDFAAQNHIRYLQLTSQHLDPSAPAEETRRKLALLSKLGLVPYTFGVNATSTDKEANRKLFEFARLIGAKLIVVEPAMADWDSLESLVKEYDIKLAIHNHGAGTIYGDPRVVKQVLATRDRRIGVCLDVGWVTAAGFDATRVFRDYGDRVYDIHFKDKKAPSDNANSVDTQIGEGDANYAGLFAEIRKSGWSGVMAIETDSDNFARNPQSFVTAAKTFFGQHQEDWIQLFNGRDLSGWTPKITHHALGDNVANTFRVENGVIKVSYDGYKTQGFNGQFGHLFYKDPFSYYRLVVEYRFTGEQAPNGPGAWALRNSGAMLHSQDPRSMGVDQNFPISIEAQFLGGLSDGKPRPTLNVCTPGTDVVYNGAMLRDHCTASTAETLDGDQWVRTEMVVLGASGITHFVNGEKVLEYTLPQYSGAAELGSGPAAKPDGMLLDSGYISLQSESHPIEFRKVELLNLAGCMNPKAKNYKSYYVKAEPGACVF